MNHRPPPTRAVSSGLAFLKWSRWLPLAIVVAMTLLAGLVVVQQARALAQLKQRIQQENRLRMESCEEHVSDYL